MGDIRKSVEIVGEHWTDSPYYDDAERHTPIFWNLGTPFLELFSRLDSSNSVVELASGHGRHAERVAPKCKRLILMDIHQTNLDFCRDRLKHYAHIEYIKNSGFDFRPIRNAEIDSIYCYDSMVHFSPDVVQSYLLDTRRILRRGAMALYHHSNYAAPLGRHYGQNPHARNHMTFPLFCAYAGRADLEIVESREMSWGHESALDRLTLLRSS